jgi:hypothetical protein
VLNLTGPGGRSMRAAMLTRLGDEAGDVLDEFLARTLAAEQQGVRDLESLAAAFVGLDIAVKREMDPDAGQVRVMTTHGAKGLEAPIVFLPETTLTRTARGSALLETADGGFLWSARLDDDCAASAAARVLRAEKEEDEAWRLLYVALTRARDRLVLCGRVNAKTTDDKVGGWYGAMRAAFEHPAIADQVHAVRVGDLDIQRFGPDPLTLAGEAAAPSPRSPAPDWTRRPAPGESPLLRYASPSQLAERDQGPAPSPLDALQGLGRFRRGDLIHRLLQLLPDVSGAGTPDGGCPTARPRAGPDPGAAPGDDHRRLRRAGGSAVRRCVRTGQPGRGGDRRDVVAPAGRPGGLGPGRPAAGHAGPGVWWSTTRPTGPPRTASRTPILPTAPRWPSMPRCWRRSSPDGGSRRRWSGPMDRG